MSKLALILFLLAGSDDVPLELKGEITTIKVERVVTTIAYDERQQVKVPFWLGVPKGAIGCTWSFPAGVIATKKVVDKQPLLEVTAAPKGQLKVSANYTIVDFEKKETRDETASLTFYVAEDAAAAPPPPPLTPPPIVPPAIVAAGLSVLVVFEEGSPLLSQDQIDVVWGKELADYAAEKFAKVAGKPEFRRFDRKVDASSVGKFWADGMAMAKADNAQVTKGQGQWIPWIVISNGVSGFSGPLPEGGQILPLIRRFER